MVYINKLLNPKIDYVFKRIFGYIGNEDITKNLLSSIITDKIKDIELDCNPITEKDLFDDKVGILDIKAKLNNNIMCNIEMQIIDRKDIEKRILFYWSKLYANTIKAGNNYSDLQKCIIILLTDYDLDNLKEISSYITKWNIREENYSKIILTDVLDIYIIELEKAKNFPYKGNKILNSWLQFINNPEVKLDMGNEEINKAKKILKSISEDEKERRLAELREKYIMDQKAIHDHGYDKGLEAGIERGIEQGIKQNKNDIAKKMKLENIDIKTIAIITGLTEEEILKIK